MLPDTSVGPGLIVYGAALGSSTRTLLARATGQARSMLRSKTERSDQSATYQVNLHVFRTHRRAHCGPYGTPYIAIRWYMNGHSPHALHVEIWAGKASRIKRIRDAYLDTRQGNSGPDRRQLGRRDALRRRRPLGDAHAPRDRASPRQTPCAGLVGSRCPTGTCTGEV